MSYGGMGLWSSTGRLTATLALECRMKEAHTQAAIFDRLVQEPAPKHHPSSRDRVEKELGIA